MGRKLLESIKLRQCYGLYECPGRPTVQILIVHTHVFQRAGPIRGATGLVLGYLYFLRGLRNASIAFLIEKIKRSFFLLGRLAQKRADLWKNPEYNRRSICNLGFIFQSLGEEKKSKVEFEVIIGNPTWGVIAFTSPLGSLYGHCLFACFALMHISFVVAFKISLLTTMMLWELEPRCDGAWTKGVNCGGSMDITIEYCHDNVAIGGGTNFVRNKHTPQVNNFPRTLLRAGELGISFSYQEAMLFTIVLYVAKSGEIPGEKSCTYLEQMALLVIDDFGLATRDV
ncbi:hypothetical protein Tco_1508814 [Tanacetum coccineum]